MRKTEFDRKIAGVDTFWLIQFTPSMEIEPTKKLQPSYELFLPGEGEHSNKLIAAKQLPKRYTEFWKHLAIQNTEPFPDNFIQFTDQRSNIEGHSQNLDQFEDLIQRFRDILNRLLSPENDKDDENLPPF